MAETLRFETIDWSAWRAVETATLIFVVRGGEILLIEKLRGLGAGKVTGPGGKREDGESDTDCVLRELHEELGIRALDPRVSGELLFQFSSGYRLAVTVFKATRFSGEPSSSAEAIPLWVPIDAIPYARMWADDVLWLPMLLSDTSFSGRFLFDGDRMLGYDLVGTDQIPGEAHREKGLIP